MTTTTEKIVGKDASLHPATVSRVSRTRAKRRRQPRTKGPNGEVHTDTLDPLVMEAVQEYGDGDLLRVERRDAEHIVIHNSRSWRKRQVAVKVKDDDTDDELVCRECDPPVTFKAAKGKGGHMWHAHGIGGKSRKAKHKGKVKGRRKRKAS